MGGTIKLFEKMADGLLMQVPDDRAEQRRANTPVSRVVMEADVLWSDEEIAARQAEEQQFAATQTAQIAEAKERQERRASALAKLEALGITADDLKDALG